jgi:hypothetical protein
MNTTIAKTCPQCGRSTTVLVSKAGLEAWQNGALIQDALPELTASEREIIKTGIDAKCWEELGLGDD